MNKSESINNLRAQIQGVIENVEVVKKAIIESEADEKENRGEVIANITLAYRHLEDAKMRLGKVVQHLSGGVSVYDTPSSK